MLGSLYDCPSCTAQHACSEQGNGLCQACPRNLCVQERARFDAIADLSMPDGHLPQRFEVGTVGHLYQWCMWGKNVIPHESGGMHLSIFTSMMTHYRVEVGRTESGKAFWP